MLNIKHMMAGYVSFFSRVACVSLLLPLLGGCLYDIYLPQDRSAKAVRTDAPVTAVTAAPTASEAVVPTGDYSPDYARLSYHYVTVQRGDSLSQLAARAHAPMQSIIAMNNLVAPYVIHPGQQLKVPTLQRHDVRPGETLYALSRLYDTSVAELAHFNGLSEPYRLMPGMEVRVPMRRQTEVLVASTDMSAWPAPATQTDVPMKTVIINSEPQKVALPPAETKSSVTRGASVTAAPLAEPLPPPALAPAPAPTAATTSAQVPAPVAAPAGAPAAKPAPAPQPVAAPQSATEKPAEESYQVARLDLPPVPTQRYTTKSPPARSGKTFAWPVKGRVISGFGKKKTGFHNDGVNIAVKEGTPIRAAENGVVAYVGNEMRSFGNLLLISHADGYVTAYGHTQKIVVKKGDAVKKGDIVAYAGSSGNVTESQLHFEIRKKGQAVDPVALLEN